MTFQYLEPQFHLGWKRLWIMKLIRDSHSSLLLHCWVHLPVPLHKWILAYHLHLLSVGKRVFRDQCTIYNLFRVLAVPILTFMERICSEHLEIQLVCWVCSVACAFCFQCCYCFLCGISLFCPVFNLFNMDQENKKEEDEFFSSGNAVE